MLTRRNFLLGSAAIVVGAALPAFGNSNEALFGLQIETGTRSAPISTFNGHVVRTLYSPYRLPDDVLAALTR